MEKLESKEIIELARAAKDGEIKVTILTGKAREVLPEVADLEVLPLDLSGNISTVHDFLKIRHCRFEPEGCHIMVNANELKIVFTGNEERRGNEHIATVSGKMIKSSELKGLPIDTTFTTQDFAKYIRRNKHIFASSEQWSNVFKSYSNFKAKVDREIAVSKDQSGNASNVAIQKVQSNIIQEFELLIPLIDGGDKVTVKVEIDINQDLTCSLFAPDLESQFKEQANEILNEELEKPVGDKPMRDFCVTYFV